MLSLNTLQLCRQVLGQQSLSVNADRAEIAAVLDARDEIDAAIKEAEKATGPEHNGRVTRPRARAS